MFAAHVPIKFASEKRALAGLDVVSRWCRVSIKFFAYSLTCRSSFFIIASKHKKARLAKLRRILIVSRLHNVKHCSNLFIFCKFVSRGLPRLERKANNDDDDKQKRIDIGTRSTCATLSLLFLCPGYSWSLSRFLWMGRFSKSSSLAAGVSEPTPVHKLSTWLGVSLVWLYYRVSYHSSTRTFDSAAVSCTDAFCIFSGLSIICIPQLLFCCFAFFSATTLAGTSNFLELFLFFWIRNSTKLNRIECRALCQDFKVG